MPSLRHVDRCVRAPGIVMAMRYPDVKNAHIVPRVYLKSFASDRQIAVHIDHASEPMVLPIDSVGTRRRYYRRTRPKDGTPIDDIEWSLSQIETMASFVLRNIVEEWPLLDLQKKAPIAQLIAAQWVRVPNWMAWHDDHTREFIANLRRADEASKLPDTALAEFESQLLSDTQRLDGMLQLAFKLMPLFASMHWTLVEFRRPLLCTCDQPVVIWPRESRSRHPAPIAPNVGVMQALEIRLALTPRHLLLMTWSDNVDEDAHKWGASHHAANANAFTIAQSDRQWFHLPGARTPRASGALLPFSPELVTGYSSAAAASSARRAKASEIADSLMGQRIAPGWREWDIVTVRRNDTP